MEKHQIANLTLNIDTEALRTIISSGRLLEFAETAATQAAAQIPAQIVHYVAEDALRADGLKAVVSVNLGFSRVTAAEGDDGFGTTGTIPHIPHHGGTPTPTPNPFANLRMTISPEALRRVIASGRLLEFADTAAQDAATQIFSQIVQHVAEGALRTESLHSGVSVNASYQWVTGDGEPGFGNGPGHIIPRPKPPKWSIDQATFTTTGLRQSAAAR